MGPNSIFFARLMSGLRCLGSFPGSFWNSMLDFEFVSSRMVLASSRIVSSCGLPRLTGPLYIMSLKFLLSWGRGRFSLYEESKKIKINSKIFHIWTNKVRYFLLEIDLIRRHKKKFWNYFVRCRILILLP